MHERHGMLIGDNAGTLIAVICSGVGPTTLGACAPFVVSREFASSPGVNVLAGTFFACSSASFE
jgi:hypothetical protein